MVLREEFMDSAALLTGHRGWERGVGGCFGGKEGHFWERGRT